jgi:hypothetical protein
MHCKNWEERVALHVGGDLAAADAAGVERHLAECAACQVFWSEMKESLEMLQGAHAEALTPGIYKAVRERVMGHLESDLASRNVWWRSAWVMRLTPVAMAAAVVMVLANWPGPRMEMPPLRVVAVIPPALATASPALQARQARGQPHKQAGKIARQPLMVRLVTDDPNVIIYWIAD